MFVTKKIDGAGAIVIPAVSLSRGSSRSGKSARRDDSDLCTILCFAIYGVNDCYPFISSSIDLCFARWLPSTLFVRTPIATWRSCFAYRIMSLATPVRRSAGRSLVAQSRNPLLKSIDRRHFISSCSKRSSAAAVASRDDEYHVGASKPADLRKSLSKDQKKFLESAVC